MVKRFEQALSGFLAQWFVSRGYAASIQEGHMVLDHISSMSLRAAWKELRK